MKLKSTKGIPEIFCIVLNFPSMEFGKPLPNDIADLEEMLPHRML